MKLHQTAKVYKTKLTKNQRQLSHLQIPLQWKGITEKQSPFIATPKMWVQESLIPNHCLTQECFKRTLCHYLLHNWMTKISKYGPWQQYKKTADFHILVKFILPRSSRPNDVQKGTAVQRTKLNNNFWLPVSESSWGLGLLWIASDWPLSWKALVRLLECKMSGALSSFLTPCLPQFGPQWMECRITPLARDKNYT